MTQAKKERVRSLSLPLKAGDEASIITPYKLRDTTKKTAVVVNTPKKERFNITYSIYALSSTNICCQETV